MKRIMLVGAVGVGKTSLIHALNRNCDTAEKTQSICFYDGAIDTPGEYAQIPRFYSALMVTAAEASIIVVVQDATQRMPSLPPGFAGMFSRPVIGVVSKMDLPAADEEKAKSCLKQVGVTGPIFPVSSHTGQGLKKLTDYLTEGGCNV